MNSNQKMLLLGIVALALFFLVPWAYIIGIGIIVLLILFRDPLWDLAQLVGKAIFPVKKVQ